MENVIEIPVHPVKKFVRRHKVAVAVTTTIVVMVIVNRKALKQHDEFLKEHDLYNEFYHAEEF